MTIRFPRNLLNIFKAAAKSQWPNEAYAILLGRKAGDKYFIEDLYIPEEQHLFSSPMVVCIDEKLYREWWYHAAEHASEIGLDIIGDLHTHTYTERNGEDVFDSSPSEEDWGRLKASDIQGICAIRKMKNGRFRTNLVFWPGTVPEYKLEITKK